MWEMALTIAVIMYGPALLAAIVVWAVTRK